MRDKEKGLIFSFIFLFFVITYCFGFKDALYFMLEIFKFLSNFFVIFFNNSFFSILFKHKITFAVVGLLLVNLGFNRDLTGKIFGKFFYFLVGIPVGLLLDYLSNIIFN